MAPHQQFDAGPVPLDVLLGRAAELAALDPREVPIDVLREGVLVHAELAGRMGAEALRWTAAFDAAGVAGLDGARTTPAWLKGRTELSPEQASGWVGRGRGLRSCPHVAAAHAAG